MINSYFLPNKNHIPSFTFLYYFAFPRPFPRLLGLLLSFLPFSSVLLVFLAFDTFLLVSAFFA